MKRIVDRPQLKHGLKDSVSVARGRSLGLLAVLLFAGSCTRVAVGTWQSTATMKIGQSLLPSVESLADYQRSTLVLITHPTPMVLSSYRAVVGDEEIAKPRDLVIVGLYHEHEQGSFISSPALLRTRRGVPFFLLGLRCPIGRADIFRANGCTTTFDKLVRYSSAIIFSGGADIPPEIYREKTMLTTRIKTPFRQYWEISLMAHLLGALGDHKMALLSRRPTYSVLAICMGMQLLNVASGGTLIQDIPSEVYGARYFEDLNNLIADLRHRSADHYLRPDVGHGPGVYHALRLLDSDDDMAEFFKDGKGPRVLSIHHQAVEKTGRGLRIIASSVDGKIPEAMRHERYPNVFAVQFHPELFFRERSIIAGKSPGVLLSRERRHDILTISYHRWFWNRFFMRLSPPIPSQRGAAVGSRRKKNSSQSAGPRAKTGN